MPLVNGPTLTPKKLAANRANAQPSRGPITLEGLLRMRDSKMKHGAYAQTKDEALRALGEDPKDFEPLLIEESQAWQATRDWDREDLIRTNAPYFRDSAVAKSKPKSEVLLRREDASFRQVGRLIDLLTKLKRDAWHAENKKNNIENEGESDDIVDNKGRNFLSHDVEHNTDT